jgi:ArsR family metal-binding transcriptional regulator
MGFKILESRRRIRNWLLEGGIAIKTMKDTKFTKNILRELRDRIKMIV